MNTYNVDRVPHADAVEKLYDNSQSDQQDGMSSKLVAEKQENLFIHAESVAAKAQKMFDRHFGVRCNLQAFRDVPSNASLVTTESQASDASETRSGRKSASFIPDFDAL